MSDKLIGRTLGQYEIVALLGKGGMARVYRGRQTSIGREVALKVLPNDVLDDETFLERFEREVQVIAQLQHPRILPVYDFGQSEGMPYIVMAYMAGGTLEDKIRSVNLGLALSESVRLVAQIAEALDFAHAQGIVHRDFKPANVLLDATSNAYLADFGIARVVQNPSQLTGTSIVGTPAYIAPETATQMTPHRSFDIYALGVTLYQMLAGRVPFESTNPMGVLLAHLAEPVPDIRQRRPELPEDVQVVLEKAMAKDPDLRYQSAGELAHELYAAATTGLARQFGYDDDDEVPEPEHPTGQHRTDSMRKSGVFNTPSDELPTIIDAHPPMPEGGTANLRWGPVLVVLAAIVVLTFVAVFFGDRIAGRFGSPATEPAVTQPAAVITESVAESSPTDDVVTEPAPTEEAVETEEVTASPSPQAEPTPFGGGSGRLLFESFRGGQGAIYTMNPDGTDTRLISDSGSNDTQPVFAPDGLRIAYVSFASGNRDIFIMDLSTGATLQVTDNPGDDLGPSWSADGTQIAFSSNRDGNFELYIVDVPLSPDDELRPFRLTNNDVNDLAPDFSPDGTRIAFHSTLDGDDEIYAINVDGTGLTQLTNNADIDTDPRWSADGQFIIFASDRDGDLDIWRMNADGSDLWQFTDNTVVDHHPALSPDGSWIVFVSERDGNPEIYVMHADGSLPQRLTEDPGADGSPTWGP